MKVAGLTIDKTINAGQLIQMLVVGGSICTAIFIAGSRLGDLERRLVTIENRGREYVPRVERLESSDGIQNERIGNIIDGNRDARRVENERSIAQAKVNAEILSQLGAIRENVAAISATMAASRDGVPLRLPNPPR